MVKYLKNNGLQDPQMYHLFNSLNCIESFFAIIRERLASFIGLRKMTLDEVCTEFEHLIHKFSYEAKSNSMS